MSTVNGYDGMTKVAVAVLLLVGTATVTGTTSKFVAKKKFVVNTESDAQVKISYLSNNFEAWFLSGDGKIEEPISEQTLRYHKLREFSIYGQIIAELGGEAKAETTLSEMFSLMEKQKDGFSGTLLNNGYVNTFCIRDQNGVLRAVRVYWNNGGWSVDANSVEDPDYQSTARRVFSRN